MGQGPSFGEEVGGPPLHVKQARAPAAAAEAFTADLGDARRLDHPDTFDVVLLLGPLYHLIDGSDRIKALGEARFAAAISRFASRFDGLSRGFLFEPDFRSVVSRDLAEGQHRNPIARPGGFTTAFFHHPDEMEAEAHAAGLAVRELVGVEGVAGWLRDLDARWDDSDDRETILYCARAVEAEPALRGHSGHLLLVAERAQREK